MAIENLTLRKIGQGHTVTLEYESLLLKELNSENCMQIGRLFAEIELFELFFRFKVTLKVKY